MRILYALGPGDVVRSYRDWSGGNDVASETSVSFSSQFFEYCRASGVEGHAVSSHPREEILVDGPMVLENRPKALWAPRGARYHLSSLLYALSLARTSLRRRVDLVIVDTYTTHWFMLSIFRLLGIPVVASLHGTLWPRGFPFRRWQDRMVLDLDRLLFWRRGVAAVVCVSPECERQVKTLQGDRPCPVFQYRAQYRPAVFQSVPPPRPLGDGPLRVLFAGRVERDKGVFDLVEAASRMETAMPGRVEWHLCGTGGAFDELEARVRERGLEGVVRLLGQLDRPALRDQYAWSQLVVVPTRSECREGLPMAAAEAALAGRPMILSAICPAVEVLGDACVEVTPDDPDAYAEAIHRLLESEAEYARRRRACEENTRQFVDPGNGLASAIGRAVGSALRLRSGRQVPPKP